MARKYQRVQPDYEPLTPWWRKLPRNVLQPHVLRIMRTRPAHPWSSGEVWRALGAQRNLSNVHAAMTALRRKGLIYEVPRPAAHNRFRKGAPRRCFVSPEPERPYAGRGPRPRHEPSEEMLAAYDEMQVVSRHKPGCTCVPCMRWEDAAEVPVVDRLEELLQADIDARLWGKGEGEETMAEWEARTTAPPPDDDAD